MADTSDTPLADRANDLGSRLAARQSSHYQVGQSQALALRAQQQLINEHVSQERFQNQTQLLELNRIRQLTEIAKERAVLQNQMTQQVHSANAITALGALDPNDPQYTTKMAHIFHDNPMASKDPIIESLVKSHLESRHVVETTAAHLESFRQEESMRLQQEKDSEPDKVKLAGDEETARINARSAGKEGVIPTSVQKTMADLQGRIAKNQEEFKTASESDKPKLVSEYKGLVEQHDALSRDFPTGAQAKPATDPDIDAQAVEWAKSNPDDPRSSKILEHNSPQ